MKHSLLIFSLLITGAASLLSCKKEDSVENGSAAEPRLELYKAPDTMNARPGHYFVTFKDSFKKPFAKVYAGGNTIRGEKEASADAYNLQAKADMQRQLINAAGGAIVPLADVDAFVSSVIVGFSAQLTSDAVKKLVANPNVEFVEYQNEENTDDDAGEGEAYSQSFSPQSQIVDPLRTTIGFKNGYTRSLKHSIWIIDGGCDMDHPDLNVYAPYSKSFSDDPTPEDRFGHGTKVAGVLAAIDNGYGTRGVAAGAYINAIKIKNKNEGSTTSNFVKALDYVWKMSAAGDVVNISQSFATSKTSVEALEKSIRSFYGYDVYFAVSAGNQKDFASRRSPARMASPEYTYSETLHFLTTVSSYGSGYKFSTIFPVADGGGSNFGLAVTCASAGEGIYSTAMGGEYTTSPLNGTSYSAPIVAGILFMNDGVYYKKFSVTGDVDKSPDKVALLNYY